MDGILLINLGSPEAPTPQALKPYLAEFLMDPWVIDIPWMLRWILVHGIILRTRPKRSASQYQKIWTEKGSPLMVHSQNFYEAFQKKIEHEKPGQYAVELAMRYGSMSILKALKKLKEKKINSLHVIPLYPQYSLAATESAIQKVADEIQSLKWHELQSHSIRVTQYFYDDPNWINVYVDFLKEKLAAKKYDHVLFSYHGIPERHVRKTDPTLKHCLSKDTCCDRITDANRLCYRAHCVQTTKGLVAGLGLKTEDHSIAFQSRLGRTPWIPPYLEDVMKSLVSRGKKNIAVISPSFTADCLETVEELAIRGVSQFKELGGESFEYIPALNADPRFVDYLVKFVQSQNK